MSKSLDPPPSPPASEMEGFIVIEKWYGFLRWLFPVAERFPKRLRFSLTKHIEIIALEVMDELVNLRYVSNGRLARIQNINLILDRLRLHLRLVSDLGVLPHRQHHFASEHINEFGKMVGGWARRITSRTLMED